jgi:hypothetical protein
MLPYALSLNADSDRASSAPLVFFTSTLYLTVAQPAWVLSKPLVTVAVLAASVDVTVTVLDWVLVKTELVLIDEWPDALTVSVTDLSSPWTAVKVQVPVAPGAIGDGGQVKLVAVPTVPGAQDGVNPLAVNTVPYLSSQIWSTTTLLPLVVEVLVMATV